MRTKDIEIDGRHFKIAPITVGLSWEIDDEAAALPPSTDEGRRGSFTLVKTLHASIVRAMGDAAPTFAELARIVEPGDLHRLIPVVWELTGLREKPAGETPSP